MHTLKSIALAAGLACAAAGAQAQVVGIGTTAGGANAQVGASIASVVSQQAGFQMRPQKMSGTQQYVTAVNTGRLEFGVSNAMQYYMAVSGTGLSEGNPNENLRLAATLMPFIQGVIVRKSDGIDSIADLAGKRIPSGYSGSPLFATFWEAFLASEGLSYDDVQQVPVASLPKSWDAFKEGQVDAVIAAAGSAPVREMEAAIEGGIKYLPLEDSEELREMLPRTRVINVEPNPNLIGIEGPTDLHVYEYVLFTHADVEDDIVYETVKAIYENEEALRASTPLWNTFAPEDIGMDHQLDYHPGAQRFFEENGVSGQ